MIDGGTFVRSGANTDENLEYCNGRLCAVAAVGRAGVKADTHEGTGAAPAGTPIGSGARRRCRQRHVEGGQGQAGIEMRPQAPLSRPPSAAQRLRPACSEPVPPNLQV